MGDERKSKIIYKMAQQQKQDQQQQAIKSNSARSSQLIANRATPNNFASINVSHTMHIKEYKMKTMATTTSAATTKVRRVSGLVKDRRRLNLSPITTFVYLLITLVATSRWQSPPVNAQCPVNTMTSFERISGITVKDSLLTVLYTAPNISSFGHHHQHHSLGHLNGVDLNRQLSAANMNIPITAECNNRCRRSAKCRAFLVDYGRHTCYSIEYQGNHGSPLATSSTGLVRTPTPIHLIPTQERTSYFEKVCLSWPAVDCERAWIYERVLAYHIHGNDDKIIEDVSSRLKCQEHCLNEREFRCRSGEYDYLTMQCRLSMTDRHIKSSAFRPTTSNVDYFENQCVQVGNQCDAFDRFEDMDLGRAEIMRSANTSDQCQQFCTQTIKAFICRSFTWNPVARKCYLNSANSFMVGGMDKLIGAPGLTYYQRNDCIDLTLECDTTAMTLNLRTNEPFRGRMYVRDDPNSCETVGRSSLTSSLSIPFQSHARCATRELPSRYSSIVVVQQHPLIQRKSDRYIKVVCDFQTANKTITSTYNVAANPWTSTALINATSFAPKIKLRITDKFGVDINGAKLGDELYLRIEADNDSVYDMVARSVLAKSGTTDESIVLIDKDGCPTDFRIFPPLEKIDRRRIVGKFDAFKFSSDVVVRFQVDVQFCLNQCPPTSCDHNLLLNSDPSQLTDAYNNINNNIGNLPSSSSTTTTTSSTTTQASADSSLVTAAGPTLAPSYHQQRLPTSASGNSLASDIDNAVVGSSPHHRSPSASQANFSTAQQDQHSQQHYANTFNGGNSILNEPSNYFNSANSGSGVRPLSVPANRPTLTNYTTLSNLSPASATGGPNSLLDSLVTTSDPQTFEQSQLRSAPFSVPSKSGLDSSKDEQKLRLQQQQQMTSNMIDSLTSGASSNGPINEGADLRQHQNSHRSKRRRRRSTEPMPAGPQHVPLQHEIIVIESSPTSKSSSSSSNKERGDSGSNSSSATTSSSSQRRQRFDHRTSKTGGNLARSGPVYDLNGKRPDENDPIGAHGNDETDSGAVLCTTRHSLLLASVAFCFIQFLTIALCLLTWLHRRDANFKVMHQIGERLY